MKQKTFNIIAIIVFILVVIIHLIRAIFGWNDQMGEVVMPLWANWVTVVVFAYFVYEGIRLGKK